jgi:hypothetical protein
VRSKRTTIVLGERARHAAERLATLWGVTPSEAIRRAVIEVDQETVRASPERVRRARADALDRAQAVFETMDVESEIARLGDERDRW